MHDIVCNVINYRDGNCEMGEISYCGNTEDARKDEVVEIFLH